MPIPDGWSIAVRDRPSGNESYSVESNVFEAQLQFIGPWDERMDFLGTYIFPTVQLVNGVPQFTPSGQYVDVPGVYANSCTIEGIATKEYPQCDGDWHVIFEKCRITVTYKSIDYNTGNGGGTEFLTEEFDSSGQGFDVPITFQTGDTSSEDRLLENQDYRENLIIPIINYQLTQHFVLVPNFFAYEALIGRVNNTALVTPSGAKGAEVGTILYNGPSGMRRISIQGINTWEIKHSFSYNPYNWNKKINPDTGLFEYAFIKHNTRPLFEYANLNGVFV